MSNTSLASLRKSKRSSPFRERFSFLFRWDSLFYYALFSLLVGFGWIGYSLFANSFTQLLNWDTTWQYIPFAYTYHDAWRTFFSTGSFPLYDFSTYLGTDAIGSNSYYGLFDPFVVVMAFFPRAWIPQMMAILTAFKIMVAVLLTRCYLRYMGIKEWTARFAALCAGLSGYVSFFVGFPSFVSAVVYVPMILWGIEKVIKERKPGILVWSLFLEGITSFFLLVVLCIFGVLYALWRYFWTIKTRTAKENGIVIGMGIASFAVGLCLSCFTLLPSVRESALSGRSMSIGTAYLAAVKASLSSHDLRSFFSLTFEMVGDHPGRELMGLLSFFFPTAGHLALPLARSSYDAWTASLFCYTPCVILFFTALIESIRQRKGSHLLAVFLLCFLVFTNFAYYFFFAFSGNGYGRWYLVLIPLITYYCAWAFDQRESSPKFVPVLSGILALFGTIATFYLSDALLKGITFDSSWNPNHQTYWPKEYVTASEIYNGKITNAWYLYYQAALVLIEASLMVIGQKKKWLPKALCIAVAVEAIVMGNLAYLYDGLWNYDKWFAGGESARETVSLVADTLKEKDSSFYRTYADAYSGTKYAPKVGGLNGSADFHSLMNFDVEEFALNNHMKFQGSVISSYGSDDIYNPSWSGYYGNKRESTDSMIGYRYYQISNSYSAWKDPDHLSEPWFLKPNVPFGAEEIEVEGMNRDVSRLYGVPESSRPSLGWAVDSRRLYPLIPQEGSFYRTNFFSPASGLEGFRYLLRVEDVQSHGAMVPSDVTLPKGFTVRAAAPDLIPSSKILSLNKGLKAQYYRVGDGDLMIPSTKASYYQEGLGYFLNHYVESDGVSSLFNMERDCGMVAFTSSTGEYFNDDINGTYFELKYYNNCYTSGNLANAVPRVYCIGDSYDEDGHLVKENDLLCFEYNAFENARKVESNRSYYGSRSSTFGLYAKGRVKAVVFCFTGSKTDPIIRFDPTNVYLYPTTYADWKAQQDILQKDKFQNVAYETNVFTFDTSYEEDRIVVTQLGYDAGWQATAFMPGGEKIRCQMIKLDGGLVGFVAPSALDEEGNPLTVHYELRYSTPGSSLSAVAWGIGASAFSAYLIYAFVVGVKEEKKKLALAAREEEK